MVAGTLPNASCKQEPQMQFVIGQLELLRRFGAKLGPYVLLELLLPGGTLFALLLFLYQRWKLNAGSLSTLIGLAPPPALVSTLGRVIPAKQPCHAVQYAAAAKHYFNAEKRIRS
jgi:hypothetical protein